MCISICPLLFSLNGCCVKRHLQLWAFSLACDTAGECFIRILYTSKADVQQPGMGDVPSYTSVTEQGMWNWLFLVKELGEKPHSKLHGGTVRGCCCHTEEEGCHEYKRKRPFSGIGSSFLHQSRDPLVLMSVG